MRFFRPVWFAMVGFAMLLLFVITLIIFTIQQVMDGKSTKDECKLFFFFNLFSQVYGLGWIFYMIAGAFAMTIYSFIKVLRMLNGDQAANSDNMLSLLLPPIIYLLVTLILFLILRKKLPYSIFFSCCLGFGSNIFYFMKKW